MIDVSNPEWQQQTQVVEALIGELGADHLPRINVFNKCDLGSGDIMFFLLLPLPFGRDLFCSILAAGVFTQAQ